MSERKVKLPGLPSVTESNLTQVVRLLVERAEVREGARGAALEAVVTRRDLVDMGLPVSGYPARGGFGNSGGAGVMVQNSSGGLMAVSMDAFSESLRNSKLYSSLTKRLDDVSRFDDVPEKVRALLLKDIASEAAIRGADIQRVDYKLQSATESIAYTMQEITAAVANASAGVREVTYASATENLATAGKITQIQARLDDVGGVTIEESMTATASRVAGLAGEYTVKINAGGAVAGFGLAASEDPTGATTSAFIVQANKFAVMMPGLGSTIPFGVDASGVYINGSLRVNAGGATIADSVGKYTDYIFRRSATAPATPTGNTPASWFDTPPSGADPLYMAVADKTAAGVLIGAWSTPVRLDGAAGTPGATGGVGATGADGITTYTWFSYANNSTGTSGFTTGAWSNHTYIGVAANKTTATESTNPADYSWALIKGEQGAAGTNGTNGTNGATGATGLRGSVTAYTSGSAWSDTTANSRIGTVTGTAYKVIGDTVTISNGTTFAETRYWSGASWVTPGVVIDGNLLVSGTISASKLSAGTMNAGELRVGGFNGYSKFNTLGSPAAIITRDSNTLQVFEIKETISNSTATLANITTGTGSTAIALEVTGQSGGGAAKFFNGTTKEFWAAPGGYSAYAPSGKGKFYPTDGTGPFTGFHDALLPRGTTFEIGDIVVDTAILFKPDINNTLSAVALSSSPSQKTAIGVISSTREIDEFINLPYEDWWSYVADYLLADVNAVGEGQINVCGEGGDLEAGDLIVTSSTPGKGMKQSDDLIRNTTVAKCRENVTFAPGEVRMVACIYLCG